MIGYEIAQKIAFDHMPVLKALLPLCFLLMVAGLIVAIYKEERSPLSALVGVALIVGGFVSFEWVVGILRDYVAHIVHDVIQADPLQIVWEYAQKTQMQTDPDGGWTFGRTFNVVTKPTEAMVDAFLILVSIVAGLIMFIAYLLQHFFLSCALAVSPIFFGFLAIGSTRSVAVHFLLSVSGVISWPIGWAISSIFTKSLFGLLADQSFFVQTGKLFFMNLLIGGFVVGAWIILSTVLAPFACQKLITTGVYSGSGVLERLIQRIR